MRKNVFAQSMCSHNGCSHPPDKFFKKTWKKKAIRNHPLIHANLIISAMNVKIENQILVSDVNYRIFSLQIFRNQKLRINNLTGTRKSLKVVRIDQIKYIRCRKTVQMKSSHRIYMRLCHVCLPIQRVLEENMETDRNWPIGF